MAMSRSIRAQMVAPHDPPVFSDLWGGPPRYDNQNSLRDWVSDDTHIFREKKLPTQTYRRNFRFQPVLAQVRAGDRVEHLSRATMARHLLPKKPPVGLHFMRVHVHMAGYDHVHLEVAPHETVAQLKARLQDIFPLPARQQVLLWRGVGLPDNRLLQQAHGVPMPDGAELWLADRSNNQEQTWWAGREAELRAVREEARLVQDSPEVRHKHGLSVTSATKGFTISCLGPEDLLDMLLTRSCFVVDAREAAESKNWHFPHARRDASFLTLWKRHYEAETKIAALRSDGRPVIAVSATGLRCEEYCVMLVDRYGFPAEKVGWLDGGLRAWEAWEAQNRELGQEIRLAAGLPVRRSPVDDGNGAADRQRSVEILRSVGLPAADPPGRADQTQLPGSLSARGGRSAATSLRSLPQVSLPETPRRNLQLPGTARLAAQQAQAASSRTPSVHP